MASVSQIKPRDMIAEDDGVRERHGVVLAKSAQGCFVDERNECVRIRVVGGDYNVESNTFVTPAEARYLASKLRRVARRVQQRITPQ